MATTQDLSNIEAARDEFYERLEPENLAALWNVLAKLVPPVPTTQAVPAAWSFGRVKELLMEAGELITAAEAERRVLILENPALPGESRITQTLYGGLQLILPERLPLRIGIPRTRCDSSWTGREPLPRSTASARI